MSAGGSRRREIDVYEAAAGKRKEATGARVVSADTWKRAWCACAESLLRTDDAVSAVEGYHLVVESWMPLINAAFELRIASLERYAPLFFYLYQIEGTREVLQAYVDDASTTHGGEESRVPLYLVFNVPLFKKLHAKFCSVQSDENYLVDHERGTVSLQSRAAVVGGERPFSSSDLLRRQSVWYLLFLATCHAMAHLDAFERQGSCFYENHERLRESPFYRMRVYGTVAYQHA